MKPTIDDGSLVIARRADPASLSVGNVIAFKRPSDGERILHRVVEIRELTNGKRLFTTKGDSNSAPDQEVLTLETGDTYRVVANVAFGLTVATNTCLALTVLSLFALAVRFNQRKGAKRSTSIPAEQ